MTIFDIINDIFKTKKGNLTENQEFYEVLQSPYILQRWITMHSTQTAYLVSETTNKLCKGLTDDKALWYKLFLVLIDKKTGYKRINYLKREKVVVNEEKDTMIEQLARINEMSKKEITAQMKLLDELTKGVA